MTEKYLASVIIPTRNRSGSLLRLLESLVWQSLSFDKFEVVVVDNGSTDDTGDRVAAIKARLPNIRYIRDGRPGLHMGRHAGMAASHSDVLVFADDDIVPVPTWVEAIVDAFADPGIALVGGPVLPEFERKPPRWLRRMWSPDHRGRRVLGYLSIVDLGRLKKEISPFLVFGCNFAIRKQVLAAAGGFHPDGVPDEALLFRGDGETHVSFFIKSAGLRALYVPSAAVRHLVPSSRMSIEYFAYRAKAQGVSDSFAALRRAYRGSGPDATTERRRASSWRRWLSGLKHNPLGAVKKSVAELLLMKIRRYLKTSHDRGYSYHQAECLRNAQLMEWVLRQSYLGDCGVIPFTSSKV